MNNIKTIRANLGLNIDGNAHDTLNSESLSSLNRLMSDFNYKSTKHFLLSNCRDFGFKSSHFNVDDFDIEGRYNGSINLTLIYTIEFMDGSIINVDFDADSNAIGMPDFNVVEHGLMADNFMKSDDWNTDDLDKLIMSRK